MRWRVRELSPGRFIVERKRWLWWVNACGARAFWNVEDATDGLHAAMRQWKRRDDLIIQEFR